MNRITSSTIRALIGLLLFGRRPTAISRLVVSVVVNSVYGFSWRTRTHISKKIGEGFYPPFANRDTPSAVDVVVRRSGILASAFHAMPAVVLSGFRMTVGRAQFFVQSLQLPDVQIGIVRIPFCPWPFAQFLSKTPAAFNATHEKIACDNPFFGSTRATTIAKPFPIFDKVAYHRVATKYSTC